VTGACRTSSTIALSVPTCCLDVCISIFSTTVPDIDVYILKTSTLTRTARCAVWMSTSEVFSTTVSDVNGMNIKVVDRLV